MAGHMIKTSMPAEVSSLLSRMGSDISAARKARKMTQDELAEKLNVSRRTVINMERGAPGVRMEVYATTSWIMGLHQRFLSGFDPLQDPVFQREARLSQPVRIREAQDPALDF